MRVALLRCTHCTAWSCRARDAVESANYDVMPWAAVSIRTSARAGNRPGPQVQRDAEQDERCAQFCIGATDAAPQRPPPGEAGRSARRPPPCSIAGTLGTSRQSPVNPVAADWRYAAPAGTPAPGHRGCGCPVERHRRSSDATPLGAGLVGICSKLHCAHSNTAAAPHLGKLAAAVRSEFGRTGSTMNTNEARQAEGQRLPESHEVRARGYRAAGVDSGFAGPKVPQSWLEETQSAVR